MGDDSRGVTPPVFDRDLTQTLELLKVQHSQTMEMFDKLIEMKKVHLQMTRGETNEISD